MHKIRRFINFLLRMRLFLIIFISRIIIKRKHFLIGKNVTMKISILKMNIRRGKKVLIIKILVSVKMVEAIAVLILTIECLVSIFIKKYGDLKRWSA